MDLPPVLTKLVGKGEGVAVGAGLGSGCWAETQSRDRQENRVLGGLKVKDVVSGEVKDVQVSGLFFAIGHEPATRFLGNEVELDADGYVVTTPGTTKTSVKGVFAAGDVQDKKYRQAVTTAGTG
ncbi:thioredoxin reductase 2-like [Chenopodium quinoa]|uniref:thioredoxin reductase 2-like n=1 Tax=Chenopodium quinoa TaxID=63459 RepID=UPI000B794946|nr:thioredoxin reductase 2-like [Chenopodium quinoa]